jgi:H+-transporting ATPase
MLELKGLTTEEANSKLELYGYNSIPEIKPNQLIKFLKRFWGITPLMLEFTIILEWLIDKQIDSIIILILLIFNAFIGYFQERKSNSALAMLKQQLQITVKVKRDQKWIIISAKNLVSGDIIRLKSGDFVMADAKILDGNLDVDQSSLTGESLLINKKKGDLIFSGSIVKRGEATAIVTTTGINTKFGHTVELIQNAIPKLHIQTIIKKVVKILLTIVIFSMLIIIFVSLIKNINIREILPLLVLLLVAAIPVALPTMFTISMALGSLKLSKSGLLVTRLDAVDDASAMNILCVDKTGTITTNKQRITEVISTPDFRKEDVITYGALASEDADQDPIDLAFISKLMELNISNRNFKRIEYIPFNPNYRRTEAIVEEDFKKKYIMKGAINEIFNLVSDSKEKILSFKQVIKSKGFKDYKLIAVAVGNNKDEMRLVGIVKIRDEIRSDTPKFVSELKDLGISLKMLTGDSLPIAQDVAENINLGNNIITVSDLKESINNEDSRDLLENVDGFAEIYPEDKYLIVKRFQEIGHIVGMTGDGINDAPALKQAEVGIAVSNANDVAKKSASVVLTVEGLEGIVELIKNGRKIFQRVLIWIMNKIIKTFYAVIFIILAYLILSMKIVSSLHIILFLFLTDYVTLSIATDNVEYPKRPETWNIIREIILGFILGTLIIFEGFSLLFLGNFLFNILAQLQKLQTFVFLFLIFIGYFSLLSIREHGHFWSSRPSKFLIIAMGINVFIVIFISLIGFPGFSAISLGEISFVILYSFLIALLVNDFIKFELKKYFSLRFK